MTESSASPEAAVHVGNLFVLSGGSVITAPNIGSFETNANVWSAATPRSRASTTEILPDGPSAVVAGVEHGAASAAIHLPSTSGIAGRIVPGAAYVGMGNDAVNVGQHVLQGHGAEAVTEGVGVVGQAGGALVGAKVGAALGASGGPFAPITVPVGALIVGGFGAYVGAAGTKSLGESLIGNLGDQLQGNAVSHDGHLVDHAERHGLGAKNLCSAQGGCLADRLAGAGGTRVLCFDGCGSVFAGVDLADRQVFQL